MACADIIEQRARDWAARYGAVLVPEPDQPQRRHRPGPPSAASKLRAEFARTTQDVLFGRTKAADATQVVSLAQELT